MWLPRSFRAVQGEYFVSTDNAQTLRFSDENYARRGELVRVWLYSACSDSKVVSAAYLDSEEAEYGQQPIKPVCGD